MTLDWQGASLSLPEVLTSVKGGASSSFLYPFLIGDETMTRNHTRSWHIPALACGGNNRRPPVPRCGAPGFDGDRDRGSPRRQHRNWLVWLRPFLQNLVGSEVELELCLAVAAGQVTFVELGRMWRMDRRTARERWLELLSRVRAFGVYGTRSVVDGRPVEVIGMTGERRPHDLPLGSVVGGSETNPEIAVADGVVRLTLAPGRPFHDAVMRARRVGWAVDDRIRARLP